MLNKTLDCIGRATLYAANLILSRKAKLRAAAWVMRLIAKQAGNKPVWLEFESSFGDLSLTLTETHALFTWQIPVAERSSDDEKSEPQQNEKPDQTPTRDNTSDPKQSND
jgi:hypothetical protein